jgi:hypothetical protein
MGDNKVGRPDPPGLGFTNKERIMAALRNLLDKLGAHHDLGDGNS